MQTVDKDVETEGGTEYVQFGPSLPVRIPHSNFKYVCDDYLLIVVDADTILNVILQSPHENEVLEFKDRKTLNKDEMGQYFSALSNEANLNKVPFAWMIFGITDSGEVVNSNIFDTVESRNKLRKYVSEQCSNRLSYTDIIECHRDDKRVLLFQIPAALPGIPTAFKNIAYERQGDSIFGLSEEKRRRIMSETIPDWSATIVPDGTIDLLDTEAISKAREFYVRNRPAKEQECSEWDDMTFLNKVGLTINGRLTYAALILLGRPENAYMIPGTALRIRWILRDEDKSTIDNEFFDIPFILATEDVCAKIRNIKYEYFRPGTLIPDRMETYDPAMLREILYNCIAHQDYTMNEYTTVVEYDRNRLVFKNAGDFIPGTIEAVLESDAPASRYRNRCLAESMARLGMVDIAGGGIRKMFKSQIARFFPLPEYDLSDDHVQVTITGKVIDSGFADILIRNPRISFEEVILLDKVQKGKPIPAEDARRLRAKGYIEGRRPNYIISASLANSTDDVDIKTSAVLKKGFDDQYYLDLIMNYVEQYGHATKSDLRKLLSTKLPDTLSDEQKNNKVGNLIRKLVGQKKLINEGTSRNTRYVIPR